MSIIPQKTCIYCKEQFPATLGYFYSDKSKKDGLSPRCKRCYKIDRKPRPILPQGYMRCPKCRNDFPATTEYFYRHAARSNGLAPYCKPCQHIRHMEHYERSLIKAGMVRRPRRKGEGPDLVKRKAYEKRWFREGGNEIVKANTRNRRARLRQAEGKHTAKDIQVQYDRQKGKCYWCHQKVSPSYHIDHIVPIVRGGSNWPSNLVIACPTCNVTRNHKLPHEWPEGGRLL